MRLILHSDMNSFYASVAVRNNPQLAGLPVAVCGSSEDRHGIVLAKTDEAKAYGIITGETINNARRKCRDLIIVPPTYAEYTKFSEAAREIYCCFTHLVEPYGPDEAWLEVTDPTLDIPSSFEHGRAVAAAIQGRIQTELGLKVSIGLSYNKFLAKMGSELAPRAGILLVDSIYLQTAIWALPINKMFGVGRATATKFAAFNVRTIGDLAHLTYEFCHKVFGKAGTDLWRYANGIDDRPVANFYDTHKQLSISRGITCRDDLLPGLETERVIFFLAQKVWKELSQQQVVAGRVGLNLRFNNLETRTFYRSLDRECKDFLDFRHVLKELYMDNYGCIVDLPVRSVTVFALKLSPGAFSKQISLLDMASNGRAQKLDKAIADIRTRFGDKVIDYGSLNTDIKLPKHHDLPKAFS